MATSPVTPVILPRSVSKSKPNNKSRSHKSKAATKTLSYEQFQRLTVVQQVNRAFMKGTRVSAILGVIVGGFVPFAVWATAHFAITPQDNTWATLTQIPALLVVGGLLYSAKTVFQWVKAAYGDPYKALGFVVLLEGTLTFTKLYSVSTAVTEANLHNLMLTGLNLSSVMILVFINSVAAACGLQVRKEEPVTSDYNGSLSLR